ncbi:MAG: hypothetical protein AABY22_33605, partial [Nanoarchaeota archaeon]
MAKKSVEMIIPLKKLVGKNWKLEEVAHEINKGELSYSKDVPAEVSYIPFLKKYLIVDGHHRIAEQKMDGKTSIKGFVSEHVPKTYNIDENEISLISDYDFTHPNQMKKGGVVNLNFKEELDKKFNISGKYKEQGIEFGKGIRQMITDGEYAGKITGKEIQSSAEKLYDALLNGDWNVILNIRDKYFKEWNKSKSLAGTQRDRFIPINTAKLELYNKANAALIYIDGIESNSTKKEEPMEE